MSNALVVLVSAVTLLAGLAESIRIGNAGVVISAVAVVAVFWWRRCESQRIRPLQKEEAAP